MEAEVVMVIILVRILWGQEWAVAMEVLEGITISMKIRDKNFRIYMFIGDSMKAEAWNRKILVIMKEMRKSNWLGEMKIKNPRFGRF